MNKKIYIILSIIMFSLILSNSRVSFLRPGSFMRISDLDEKNQNQLFTITMGSEITSLGDILSHSSGFAYNKTYINGTSFGLSYIMLPYTGIDIDKQHQTDDEIGVHFQTPIYTTGRSTITGGVHDFIISDDIINIKDISFFVNFSNTLSSESIYSHNTSRYGYRKNGI